MAVPPDPAKDCPLCPRLAAFRAANRSAHPGWYNGAVPGFGDKNVRLLIVGLAPGLKGANRTGRPFTGDFAGDLLYPTLLRFGFAEGRYLQRPDDGLRLKGALITNAVRCVPPVNKPTGSEIKTCRRFLEAQLAALPSLSVILALGRVAHTSTVAALGRRQKDLPFAHGAKHPLDRGRLLVDSYHCSRYNTNTGRLTPAMFEALFRDIRNHLC